MTEAKIGITDHKVRCWVGIEEHEKSAPQDLFVTVAVRWNVTEAVQEDHLSEALDYTRLAAVIDQVAGERHYHLIETLADHILKSFFKKIPEVHWAQVRIDKPQALPSARCAYVEMERTR